MKSINVVGLGYIGLPTALMFAANGISMLVGTDLNIKCLVNKLNSGKLTFKENGLEELFKEAQKNEIEFSTELFKNRYVYNNLYQHHILRKVKR